jgi:hypothetical protein
MPKKECGSMQSFDQNYEEWLQMNLEQEANPRRRGLLEKGLGHGTVEFLQTIWYPTVKNFDHLYPEWEVRDFNGGYRYVDLAYRPGGMKGAIEIQGYGSHARDLDVVRFKDLCWRHSLMAIDRWIFLPVAYLSIKDEPWRCRQLVLSFIGTFLSTEVSSELTFLEAETVRFSRRLLRPFTPVELAGHLRITDRHARRILHYLVERGFLIVHSGEKRYRTYCLRTEQTLFGGK